MTNYPEKIVIDVDATLHLEHTDTAEGEHRTLKVSGTINSFPNRGDYDISLETEDGTPFSDVSGGVVVVLIIIFILDWPTPANAHVQRKRERLGLKMPENFLDLSNGEYEASLRLNFDENNYGYKTSKMEKIDDAHYKATVETIHHYPKAISEDMTRILSNDIALSSGGPGKIFGRTQARWLKEDNSIVSADAVIEVNLKNKEAELPFTEVYSYDYTHGDFCESLFTMHAKGLMRAVDTAPTKVDF